MLETFLFMIVDSTRQASATFFYPLKHPDLVFFFFLLKIILVSCNTQITNFKLQGPITLFLFLLLLFLFIFFFVYLAPIRLELQTNSQFKWRLKCFRSTGLWHAICFVLFCILQKSIKECDIFILFCYTNSKYRK